MCFAHPSFARLGVFCLALGVGWPGASAPTQAQELKPQDLVAAVDASGVPVVQIVSAADGAVALPATAGTPPRLSARGGQAFMVLLQYPAALAGGEVALDPLDGGKIDGRAYRKAKIDAAGKLSFVFTAGQNLGSYQVEIRSPGGVSAISFAVEPAPAP